MRCTPLAFAGFLALAVTCVAPSAALAQTEGMGMFSWLPPARVQEAMEKDRVPGIFVFEVPGELASHSVRFNFSQAQVIDVLRRNRFACCKVTVIDVKSSRPWGSYQKLADEFGVALTTTVVVTAFDRTVLALISQVIKRDEFIVFLGKMALANKSRVKATDDASNDLSQAEKWIDEKKYADASRRVENVLKKESSFSKKVGDRAKEVDGRLETIGKERLEEGKRLLDAGKTDEARPILEEVASAFARFECGKEAKDLLKKAGKA